MTTEEALRAYLVERGFVKPDTPRNERYRGNWIKVHLWGHLVPVLPIYGFKKSLMLHDIHHVLSGYETDWRGELEIAAWELSSGGCGWYVLYWIDRIIFMSLGLIFCPVRTVRAFRRGRGHRNTFDRDPEELLASDYEELERRSLRRSEWSRLPVGDRLTLPTQRK